MIKERFKVVAAVHIFLLKENDILLLRRFNTGYEDGKYSVLAGHLDGDEDLIEAAQREILEEGGVNVSYSELNVVGVMHRKAVEERIDFFLTCDKWEGEVKNMEPHKCDNLSWFPLDNLPENIIPYVRTAIDNYKNNKPFDIYGF
ncbi:NUDIX domain-containing protein [Salibacterium salarium]|uniref:NUDIX domain-containing protein n=1 Tax=Salibacterium salarium TaxID=284579 RepID=A0A428MV98_9BACI|nr:NUDIX domain-containing protein [Salibacterium salarium]RSL30073.1 NUDIX domain-containing protein [Salibacterium salarium]